MGNVEQTCQYPNPRVRNAKLHVQWLEHSVQRDLNKCEHGFVKD